MGTLMFGGIQYVRLLEDDGVIEVREGRVFFDGKKLEDIFRERTGLGNGSRQKAYILVGYQPKPSTSEDIVPA